MTTFNEMMLGFNALRQARNDEIARQREAGMRNVLNQMYQPAVTPTMPDVIQALGGAGYAPEALQMQQQMERTTGQDPAIVKELQSLGLTPGTPEWNKAYWNAKRSYQVQTIGGGKFKIDAQGNIIPLSTREQEIAAAAEAAGAKTTATQQATAAQGLPAAEYSAERTKTQIDDLLKMPGLESAFGARSYLPSIRGTDRANFEAKLEQLKSTIFLANRAKLKGGGSITDYEGQQAANAETAMSQAQTADQFKKAMEDYKYWVDVGLRKLRESAGKTEPKKTQGNTYQSSGGISFTVK